LPRKNGRSTLAYNAQRHLPHKNERSALAHNAQR